MNDLTDERLLELANTTGLLSSIRLAAACHPDRMPLEEICSPANAALLRFARAVLAEDCDPHPYDEILDFYDALAAQSAQAVYHSSTSHDD